MVGQENDFDIVIYLAAYKAVGEFIQLSLKYYYNKVVAFMETFNVDTENSFSVLEIIETLAEINHVKKQLLKLLVETQRL